MKLLESKYNAKESEIKWQKYWADKDIFRFDWNDTDDRNNIYAIDTPPPTVSGVLHMGHVFSYSQAEFIARFQRMLGKNVFFPIGFDDNGLPTERYIEKLKNIKGKSMPRQEFVRICRENIGDVEREYENVLRMIGFSYDWNEKYQTISDESKRISQMSFLDLYRKGVLYRKEEPVIWDVIDQTALAQTEVEDREFESQMNYVKFSLIDKNSREVLGDLEIMTTRPELIVACVGVMAHPDKFAAIAKKHKGRELLVLTPFGLEVPLIEDDRVEVDKGTGVVMCCTFGDQADVEWWKKYNLELRIVLDANGHLNLSEVPIAAAYKIQLDGVFVDKARPKVLEILAAEGKITREPVKITHAVKVGERSKFPIEILVAKQWFIKVTNIKRELHEKTDQCNWNPEWMKSRMHNWIDGLSWDWCISRQRFSGIPVPAWYSKRPGEEGRVILPRPEQMPVDPMVDLPDGYCRDEVEADTDVFDTWATSSVSPQLSSRGITPELCDNQKRFEALSLPFDLRPQAHEIIRTWTFCTMVKAHYHEDKIPWKNLMISGWMLASDRTKMSKSKGNVVMPVDLIQNSGADAVRYWAGRANLGMDTAFSEDAIKMGQKLVTKLFNASKFAQTHIENIVGETSTAAGDVAAGKIREAIDLWLLDKLHIAIEKATAAFGEYEYSKALEAIEDFFWNSFCDNYLEIVKIRSYGDSLLSSKNPDDGVREHSAGAGKIFGILSKDAGDSPDADGAEEEAKMAQQSALRTIYYALNAVLKLFAPFVPHVADEIFSHLYEEEFAEKKSISGRGTWPKSNDFPASEKAAAAGDACVMLLADVRRYKSDHNMSMKAEIGQVRIEAFDVPAINSILEDLKNVCNIRSAVVMQSDSKTPTINIVE